MYQLKPRTVYVQIDGEKTHREIAHSVAFL